MNLAWVYAFMPKNEQFLNFIQDSQVLQVQIHSKIRHQKGFFFCKKKNRSIQQWCIKHIKSDSVQLFSAIYNNICFLSIESAD